MQRKGVGRSPGKSARPQVDGLNDIEEAGGPVLAEATTNIENQVRSTVQKRSEVRQPSSKRNDVMVSHIFSYAHLLITLF